MMAMNEKLKVYVVGPYSAEDESEIEHNVDAAIRMGEHIAEAGFVPFIPHLFHFWGRCYPHEYEFWMMQDIEWLKVCDAILRLPGESRGADREVGIAQDLGLRLFFSIENVPKA